MKNLNFKLYAKGEFCGVIPALENATANDSQAVDTSKNKLRIVETLSSTAYGAECLSKQYGSAFVYLGKRGYGQGEYLYCIKSSPYFLTLSLDEWEKIKKRRKENIKAIIIDK